MDPMIRPHHLLAALLVPAALALASPHDEAAALIAKGQFLAAERIIEPLASVKKPDALSLYQLSQVRTGQGHSEEAIELAERAIKVDPTRPEYFSQLGLALGQQMEATPSEFLPERIRKAMEQSVKLDPNHVPGLLGLSQYYSASAIYDRTSLKKTLEYANRIAKIDPFQGELELGRVELLFKQHTEALKHYEKAIQLKPNDATARFCAAVALGQLGRKAEARASLETALKLNPSLKDAQSALQALNEAGQTKPGH
jgi:tetratricopeptide (TPR) repeat protein